MLVRSLPSAYAKLGMISSALSSDSDDVTKLLNVSLDLIAPMTKSNVQPPSKDFNKAVVNSTRAGGIAGMGALKDGAGIGDSERAVEVLSFLVSKTKVRLCCHVLVPHWHSVPLLSYDSCLTCSCGVCPWLMVCQPATCDGVGLSHGGDGIT